MKKYFPKLILFFILLIAFLFRFNNLNWDSNFHLHPDERFLTMVGNAMKMPQTFLEYFDPSTSLLNPANIGYKFFVYGVFPLVLNKMIAVGFNTDTYNFYTFQGRALSALFDIFILCTLYHFVFLIEKKWKMSSSLKYWVAFFYAIAVLPIQLSHFFAVDTFLSFFMFASLFFSFKYYVTGKTENILISAILFGLALGTKINAVFILPLNLFFILLSLVELEKVNKISDLKDLFNTPRLTFIIGRFGFLTLLYGISVYIIVRLVDPYLFESSNFFNPTLSSLFVSNITELKSFEGDVWFPPAIQWITKPAWFTIKNLALYGVGIPYFLLIIVGCITIFRQNKSLIFKIVIGSFLAWLLALLTYQSFQFVKAMRYIIFLYPFFAFFAGVGYIQTRQIFKKGSIRFIISTILIVFVLIWPIAFSSIYLRSHSRVTASEWMYKNVPTNSIILTEHWDDGLPLPMPNAEGKTYTFKEMPVFGMDNEEKWQQINDLMEEGDYYVLSSNRGWGSIPTVPHKYPRMGKFYQELFAEKVGYKKVAEFTSYPTLKVFNIEIEFPDDSSDETFTVYDHPKVMIFKNTQKAYVSR